VAAAVTALRLWGCRCDVIVTLLRW